MVTFRRFDHSKMAAFLVQKNFWRLWLAQLPLKNPSQTTTKQRSPKPRVSGPCVRQRYARACRVRQPQARRAVAQRVPH